MNPQPYIAERTKSLASRGTALLVLALTLALAAPAPAQLADDTEVEVTVTRAGKLGPVITVPLNQGALVDFSVPVREVRLANPEIADVAVTSPRQILIEGKSFGSTQLLAQVDGGAQRTFSVVVDLDLAQLEASIRSKVPRARVKVSGLLDSVVLSGTVPDVQSAERILQIAQIYSAKVIDHMEVAGVQQVLLRCTVAEVNRNATRRLGFNGWMAGDNFRDANVVSNIGQISPSQINVPDGINATATLPFLTNGLGTGAPATLEFGFPRLQMQVFINALRENGLLHVLAEPNLVTISGQEATFLAGGEFPVPIPQEDAVTVEFRQFGVQLNFTPTVLSENRIRLHVTPEVSEPDFSSAVTLGGYVVPGLVKRHVDTVVELGAGQTFAISGLLTERSRGVVSKVPAFGDLPVLGALFRSVEYQKEESELVVLVTPELVAPLQPDQIAYVPGSQHVAPNDWELFCEGRLEGAATAERPPVRPGNEWPVRPAELYGPKAALRLRGPIGPAGFDEGT